MKFQQKSEGRRPLTAMPTVASKAPALKAAAPWEAHYTSFRCALVPLQISYCKQTARQGASHCVYRLPAKMHHPNFVALYVA